MKKLIELEKISYSRPNGHLCVDALTLSVSSTQRIAITGGNGSGKSTLLQVLLGLHDNVQGEIRLFDSLCKTESDFARYRTRIGYLFQDSDDQLFCPTVLEDVCFGPINQGYSQSEAEDMAHQTLRQLGIENLVGEVSYRLSGGQKRLVSLATVLVMKPEILLLDEPTNGLDDTNYQLFVDIVTALKLPMILISHDEGLRKKLTDIEYRLIDGSLVKQN